MRLGKGLASGVIISLKAEGELKLEESTMSSLLLGEGVELGDSVNFLLTLKESNGRND